jgi:diguanylate cyclase (GGDEF)-like protein/PAS domain S-box-containing protein
MYLLSSEHKDQIHGGTRRKATWRVEKLAAAFALLTALAVELEDSVTLERTVIASNQAGKTYKPYFYDDFTNGGASRVVADPHNSTGWTCVIRRVHNSGYCGFGIQFDPVRTGRGINLGGLEAVEIHISYAGPSESLRIALKNYDPGYRAFGSADFVKPMQGSIEITQGAQVARMKLRDFTAAQWWTERVSQPAKLTSLDFGNIIAIDMVTGSQAREGIHKLAIDRIVVDRRTISHEAWYGAIILSWILLIGGLLIHSRIQAGRWQRELTGSLRKTVNTIPHMVWSWDGSGPLEYNRRWQEFTGLPLRADGGRDPDELIHQDDEPTVVSECTRLLAIGEPFDFEYRLMHRSGQYRWVHARAVPERDDTGAILGWYGTCTDVHERVTAQRALVDSVTRLKWSNDHDPLTMLANRSAFQRRLQSACLKVPDGKQIGLLLIDLDHFKHVNDSLGHAAGDELLRAVAGRLKSSVRKCDLVARLGGDEFAVMVGAIRSAEELTTIGEDIVAGLREPVRIDRRTATVGASIGGALYPRDSVSMEDLFKSADAALYQLKHKGRGGVVLYHNRMLERAERAVAQLSAARTAIGQQLIVPLYQPKVELSSGAHVGFEALLRWNHPRHGLQSPDTLEEAFGDYELAAEMGEMVQRRVASDVRRWLDKGLDVGRISINASPSEFLRDDYAERFLEVLAANNVPPQRIEVEITEQALFDPSMEYVARALRVLKDAQVSVSLDDFGTGYSSLSHLRDFAVDFVKIDKSFTHQMCELPEIAAIVAAVINLSRSLAIDVIAEGVETRDQADLLRAMGCRFGQGHLFGKAATAEIVEASVNIRRAA